MKTLENLLKLAAEKKASDLHLSADSAPWLRINGELAPIDTVIINSFELEQLIKKILTEAQINQLTNRLEIDCAYTTNNGQRFRANIFQEKTGLAAAFRVIPNEIPSISQLALPDLFEIFATYRQGLILITGATGSGKSTSLAAIINHINQTQKKHIITIEDPIEFRYSSNQSLITQREISSHSQSFSCALRSALREDPDIILVGELRDLETIRLALTAAETGHLVLATLHSSSATKTIDRIIDAFPGDEKSTIRALLAECLTAVIAQELVPDVQYGRKAIFEILLTTPAIRNLIRENKSAQIYSAMQSGKALGMCTFAQSN